MSLLDERKQVDNEMLENSSLNQWTMTRSGRFYLALDSDGNALGLTHEDDQDRLVFWRNNTTLPFDVSRGSVTIRAYCARGYLTHDTKQGLIVAGIGSASSSKSCLCCLLHKSQFKLYPKWMGELCQDIPREQVNWEECSLTSRIDVARGGRSGGDLVRTVRT